MLFRSQGRLKSRSYETREGEKRTVFEVDVDEVGPSLRNATAKVTRAARSGGGFGEQGGGQGGSGQGAPRSAPDDPWATPPRGGQSGGGQSGGGGGDSWGAGASDEPPF